MVEHTALGAQQRNPIPLPYLLGGEGTSLLTFGQTDDTVDFKSVVGIKHGYSGMVIGYHADDFTCTYSAGYFAVQSHIYTGS